MITSSDIMEQWVRHVLARPTAERFLPLNLPLDFEAVGFEPSLCQLEGTADKRAEVLQVLERARMADVCLQDVEDPKIRHVVDLLVKSMCIAYLKKDDVRPPSEEEERRFLGPTEAHKWNFDSKHPTSFLPMQTMLEALYPSVLPGDAFRIAAVNVIKRIWPECFGSPKNWWQPIPVDEARPHWEERTWKLPPFSLISYAASVCSVECFRAVFGHGDSLGLDGEYFFRHHTAMPIYCAIHRLDAGGPAMVQYLLPRSGVTLFPGGSRKQVSLLNCTCLLNADCEGDVDAERGLCKDAKQSTLLAAIECGRDDNATVDALLKVIDPKVDHVIAASKRSCVPIFESVLCRLGKDNDSELEVICQSVSCVEIARCFLRRVPAEMQPGVKLLFAACAQNKVDLTRFLLQMSEESAIPILEPNSYAKLCFDAVRRNHCLVFKELLGSLSPEQPHHHLVENMKKMFMGEDGVSLLHRIAMDGNLEAFRLLREAMRSLDLNMVMFDFLDIHGKHPLDYASGDFLHQLKDIYPAQADWKAKEIPQNALKLLPLSDAYHTGGSRAPIQRYGYGSHRCPVVLKIYPEDRLEYMRHEFGIASRLDFPSLARVLGWTKIGCESYGIVMEAYGNNLYSELWRSAQGQRPLISSDLKVKWACQVGAAIRYLHAQAPSIEHGDVHVANVLLSAELAGEALPNAILCDFDRSSTEETPAAAVGRLQRLFPRLDRLVENGDVQLLRKLGDWLYFGFLLMQVATNGAWDWREKRLCFDVDHEVVAFDSIQDFAERTGFDHRCDLSFIGFAFSEHENPSTTDDAMIEALTKALCTSVENDQSHQQPPLPLTTSV